jgi:secreted trypsin-like serine protease
VKTKILLLGIGLSLAVHAANYAPNVIYGADNRQDIYKVSDPYIQDLSESIVALFESKYLSYNEDSKSYQILGSTYGEEFHLCQSERFYSQPSAAFCSGFLIAPNQVLTAGHCITNESDCAQTKLVFGYSIPQEDQIPQYISAKNIFECHQIIARSTKEEGLDFTLIELNRTVKNRSPLAVDQSQSAVRVGKKLSVLGHPSGLPMKYADNAKVRKNDINMPYFTANLDIAGGNSGSPVFDTDGLLVLGIVSSGEKDFVSLGDCNVQKQCTNASCSGEVVTRISSIMTALR